MARHAQARVDNRAITPMRLAERQPERLGAIGVIPRNPAVIP
jgi:hypothetical protein